MKLPTDPENLVKIMHVWHLYSEIVYISSFWKPHPVTDEVKFGMGTPPPQISPPLVQHITLLGQRKKNSKLPLSK